MKSSIPSFGNHPLENSALKSGETVKKTPDFKAFLNNSWHQFVHFLTTERELKVWHRANRFGNHWWEAYDPFTGRFNNFGSEKEAITWIEEEYHHW